MKIFLYTIREILEIVISAVLVVIIVHQFLVQPVLVSGSSMEPNFESGDYILVNEISYRFREPQRGEVIVFRFPGDNKTLFIKRVIGLPGEHVVITDGKVEIFNQQDPKGMVLDETYLPANIKTTGNVDVTLKNDEYFVLGDNRPASFDSRQWGTVKKSEIIGDVWMRLWPLNKVSAFETPSYQNQ